MEISTKKYVVVYSLKKAEGIDIFLPVAYICTLDKYGRPAYLEALALPENTSSFGIPFINTIHQQLIGLCHELSLAELEKSFNKNKKKHQKLSSLFADVKLEKVIQGMIDKRLTKFLELVRDNGCFICMNLSRRIFVNDILLSFSPDQAQPKMSFLKTQTGIRYELKLLVGDNTICPLQHDVLLISNNPGIIILDRNILWLSNINSTKLKPFLKNESIFIPNKMVKNFFTQFIIEIMGKVDVEADGFEINKVTKISGKTLIFIFDIFENKWVIDVRFEYEGFVFMTSEKKHRKTKIEFKDDDTIQVFECTRDLIKEEEITSVLSHLGFKKTYNNRYYYEDQKFSVLEKISANLDELKSIFIFQYPESDEKSLCLLPVIVMPDFDLINDWFDLKGKIKIGEEYYPIRILFNNIKRNDPYFKLKDGTYTIIPAALMTKYARIVKFGQEVNDEWRLSKTHFVLLDSNFPQRKSIVASKDELTDDFKLPLGLMATLRPYQIQGVKWLINHRINKLGACLSDDMGLGKTLQTIAVLLDAKENKPVVETGNTPIQLDLFGDIQTIGRKSLNALIILPASLVFNWYLEIRKYAPSLQIIQYTGASRKKAETTLMAFDVILTTYQTVVADADFLQLLHFHYIILDESQQIRNKNSKTFSAVNQLSSDHKISLSGTPIENSLSDLWSQMEFINPAVLGSYSFFKEHFQIPIEKHRDQKAIAELKLMVDPFILRRTKSQVAKDLPELIENVHYSEMAESQARYYEKEKSAARNYLAGLDKDSGQYRFHILSSLMKLRQIANHPVIVKSDFKEESGKFEDVKQNILSITKSDYKVLVFSSFLTHLNLFAQWLNDEGICHLMLTGSMSSDDRQKVVTTFQNNKEIKVFLLSIKAGGTGLNLTAADYVIILDPWWNPFTEMQAVARAHRIGRVNNVIVTRFISKDTIEEKILRLQDKKRNLSDDIIEENDWSALAQDELLDLLQ